jgi:hypothetical protein
MKIATIEKLKFKRLQRRLELPLWQAVGLLESLWKVTYRNAPAGDIGRLSNEDIAAAIEWKGDADELVAALVECRWLDEDDIHRLLIHDWEEECEAWHRGSFGGKSKKQFAKPGLAINNANAKSEVAVCYEAATKPSLSSLTLSPPPPPSPEPSPLPRLEPDWVAAEAELLEAGVGKARDCILEARSNGCNPIAVRNLITFYVSRKPAWGPGALFDRLKAFRNGQNFDELWPPQSPEVVRDVEQAATKKRRDSEASKRAADRAQHEADRTKRAELENQFGAHLDRIPRAQLRKTVLEQWPEIADQELERLPSKGPPPPGVLRTMLLEYLESMAEIA